MSNLIGSCDKAMVQVCFNNPTYRVFIFTIYDMLAEGSYHLAIGEICHVEDRPGETHVGQL